jgi:hypothetical protein
VKEVVLGVLEIEIWRKPINQPQERSAGSVRKSQRKNGILRFRNEKE